MSGSIPSLPHVPFVKIIFWNSEYSGVRYCTKYSVIQKDGLNFVRLYFLNYTWYVNYLHNI